MCSGLLPFIARKELRAPTCCASDTPRGAYRSMVRLDEVRGGGASHLCVFARARVSVCQLCGCMYSTCARAHATHTQTQARTRTWPSAGVHDGSASHARAAAFIAMSPCPTKLRSTVYVVMKLCTCVCALVCVHACMRARARVH